MKLKTLNFCLIMVGVTVSSHGALSFTEDFTDNSASPNMVLGTPFGSPTTSFLGGNFTITSGPNNRIYLGTNDADYSIQNFSFEADVTINNINAWSMAFLGMGNTTPGVDPGFPGEPISLGSPNIMMVVRPDEGTGQLQNRDNGAPGFPGGALNNIGILAGVTHGMRMEWDSVTKQATFLFDKGNDGTYDPAFTQVVDGSTNGFTGINSQLFVGGGFGLVYDNIVVTVPEPSAALLGGLGVLGLLRRRRN